MFIINHIFQWQRVSWRLQRLDSVMKKKAEDRLLHNSQRYFKKMRGKYAGRRGFVIGNGPSLRFEDLDKLKNDICIASNKIYLAFPHTKWRPTFHTIADELVARKIGSEILRYVPVTHVPLAFARYIHGNGVIAWKMLGAAFDPNRQDVLPFSDDVAKGVYGGATVTFENLQFAVHLGLNPIFILGCDHYYAGESRVIRDVAVPSTAENHFIPGYRSKGELVNPATIPEMNRSYSVAREYSEQSKVAIYNATRGGYLEVFKRMKFDEII